MSIQLRDRIFRRWLPSTLSYLRSLMESLRSGEFRRATKLWWKANGIFAIVSLVVASLVYFRIRENLNMTGRRSVPVEVTIIGGDKYTSVAVSPSHIDVYVRGTESDVRKFENETSRIRLAIKPEEMEKSRDGRVLRRIRARRDVPGIREFGLAVTKISPDVVSLTYDNLDNVQFDLDLPKLEGKPYHGDATVEITPKSVSLYGGQNQLKLFSDKIRLQTTPIDVEKKAQDFVQNCEIILPETIKPSVISVEPSKVEAHVKIEKRPGTRTFESLDVRLSLPPGFPLPPGYVVSPTTVSAKITGYERSMESLSNSMITAYAEISDEEGINRMPFATNTLPVKLEVPHDKEIWEVEPTPSSVMLIMPPPPTNMVYGADGAEGGDRAIGASRGKAEDGDGAKGEDRAMGTSRGRAEGGDGAEGEDPAVEAPRGGDEDVKKIEDEKQKE